MNDYALTIHLSSDDSLCRPDGQKKAYVKLTSDFEAADVANRLAII